MTYAVPHRPKAWERYVQAGDNFGGDHRIEIGGVAPQLQIQNNGDGTVVVRLNDDPDCTFSLAEGDIQNLDGIHVTSLDFACWNSGGSPFVQVIAGVVDA